MVGYVGSSKHAFHLCERALAEGAWVLWVQDNRLGNPTGGRWGTQKSTWRVLTASSTETECRRKLRETIERVTNPEFLPKDEKVLYKVTGDTVSFVFYPKDGGPMTANQIFGTFAYPTPWTHASREESDVQNLTPSEFGAFRRWFLEVDAEAWDRSDRRRYSKE